MKITAIQWKAIPERIHHQSWSSEYTVFIDITDTQAYHTKDEKKGGLLEHKHIYQLDISSESHCMTHKTSDMTQKNIR